MVRGNFRARHVNITQKKKRQWSAREKLMVIAYYEQGHSKRSTANKFEIEPKQLRDWLKHKEQLMKVAPYTQKLVPGARPKYPQLETELMEWFKESRSQLKTVSRYMIQAKARTLAKKPVYETVYPDIKEAKLSQKWVDGFMSRHNLVNRRKTTVAQRLPENYVEQQSDFLSYVLFRRKEHQYPLSLIANMDETPLAFNLPSNTTVEQRGTKTISTLSTGHERANFTVVLACMADGTKLPPVIIFKLVKIPRGEFPDGVIIRANPKGWMNEDEMIWWIENVWTQRARRGVNPRSLLVLDSFTAHKTDAVKKRFREKNTDLAVIPGGLTSRLQPLDVSLNKPFKDKVILFI
jgi:transposase-like protein